MSDHRDRVAGQGLYDEKFYASLREVKRQLECHNANPSSSSTGQSAGGTVVNNSINQPNTQGQPVNRLPAQGPTRGLFAHRAGSNASQSTNASNVVDLRPALELFIDPSWQFEWDGTYYYCNWPGCDRVFEATEITSRHRATHDRYRYMAGEIPLPSYPQPDQDHAASTTGEQQISLPLR